MTLAEQDLVRCRLAEMILDAPQAVRKPLCDLLMSVKSDLRYVPDMNVFPDREKPIPDWATLLSVLTGLRLELDTPVHQEIDRLRRLASHHQQLEKRFAALQRAFENSRIKLEIFYELIQAGQEFQRAEDILEQSGELLMREFNADIFVCRMRNDEGHWENIVAGSESKSHVPVFVKFMEEALPNHPVMVAVNDPETMYVLSNNLRGTERGGESFGCEAFQEGYRTRLSFILRDADRHPFGLIMLYSQVGHYFDRYDRFFLHDCASIVSLTVGRRLEMGKDALAKAAGGMAHVGNNVLGIMKNLTELIIEDVEYFLDNEVVIGGELIRRALNGIKGTPTPGTAEAMMDLFNMTLDRLDLDRMTNQLNLIVENIRRLTRAIDNLLNAVQNPVLMHYIGGTEVLDLEWQRAAERERTSEAAAAALSGS